MSFFRVSLKRTTHRLEQAKGALSEPERPERPRQRSGPKRLEVQVEGSAKQNWEFHGDFDWDFDWDLMGFMGFMGFNSDLVGF